MKTFSKVLKALASLSSLAVLFCLAPRPAAAQFLYETNNGAITITGYAGPGGALTIPAAITGLPVTTIAASAFARNSSLNSVTIANGITTIGDWAFGWCMALSTVSVPRSATSISKHAFSWCLKLT